SLPEVMFVGLTGTFCTVCFSCAGTRNSPRNGTSQITFRIESPGGSTAANPADLTLPNFHSVRNRVFALPGSARHRHIRPETTDFAAGIVLYAHLVVENHGCAFGRVVRGPIGNSGVVGVSGFGERHPRRSEAVPQRLFLTRACAADSIAVVV